MLAPYQTKVKLGANVQQFLHGYSTGFHFLISLLDTFFYVGKNVFFFIASTGLRVIFKPLR